MCESDLKQSTIDKINYGERLIDSLQQYKDIDGSQKLKRKIAQEVLFLKKILKSKMIKKEHLQCSNLTHFSALIKTLSSASEVQSVSKVFALEDRKLTVDIVCDKGLIWMKVIARNPKSLSQICMGDASFGVRSIFDQAQEYVQCAKLYPCLFQTPKIVFVFSSGIGSNIAQKLESYGIKVVGNRVKDYDILEEYSDDEISLADNDSLDLSTKNTSNIKKLNLDVSAMLAYCSSVTNGSADKYEFSVPVLSQQAAWERLRPQKPILDNLFKDKNLYCCQTAKDNFVNIVDTVGGPNEKIRAKALLDRLTVLPDDAAASDPDATNGDNDVFNKVQFNKKSALKVGGKIKQRSLTIFEFGDRIQAVTVTANDGFVRAAKQQAINFVVFVHESRALTEQKEQEKATPVNSM